MLVAALVVVARVGTGHAGTYHAKVRFRPSGDVGVTSYRVHVCPEGAACLPPRDVGLPAPDADGVLTAIVPDLPVCGRYTFFVSASASGSHSAAAVVGTLVYEEVGLLIDSDGDGRPDAVEDADRDCVVDPGESDPDVADVAGCG